MRIDMCMERCIDMCTRRCTVPVRVLPTDRTPKHTNSSTRNPGSQDGVPLHCTIDLRIDVCAHSRCGKGHLGDGFAAERDAVDCGLNRSDPIPLGGWARGSVKSVRGLLSRRGSHTIRRGESSNNEGHCCCVTRGSAIVSGSSFKRDCVS